MPVYAGPRRVNNPPAMNGEAQRSNPDESTPESLEAADDALEAQSSNDAASLTPEERAERERVAIAASLQRYGVDRWGREFLRANTKGNLEFIDDTGMAIDLQALAEELDRRGITTPCVVRFPNMIVAQMRGLHDAFQKAAKDNGFEGGHVGLYPLKVNQRRSVVQTVVEAREACHYGLEAGSKPELLLAMAQPVIEGIPLVCNGFKDREFMRMAYHAAELGHDVIVVLESVREVRRFIKVGEDKDWKATPRLGIRAKLYSRGSGRWQSSGGESAKFGLTTNEMLEVERQLREAGKQDLLVLLHFHIGSQITQIKRIKTAMREGVQLWASLKERCPSMQYLDLGGGVGVDYDGSRTSYPSSANYSIEEYASQVVFELMEVVRERELAHPTILTESGRVLVARHAVLVADMREVQGELLPVPPSEEDEHRLIGELRYTSEHINSKNIEEYFHDAVDFRDEALQLFSRGYLTLQDRASAEGLFARVRERCGVIIKTMKHPPEEIDEYLKRAESKYLVNFSIFQSLPDTWSIGQVFPVAPLSRHNRRPNVSARLVDITCDSDGCVNEFAHPDDNLRQLPLIKREAGSAKYYLGFFMTGAYQDSLSNYHNLFARCHEVILRGPDDDALLASSQMIEFGDVVLEVKWGQTNQDVLAHMDWDSEQLTSLIRDRHVDTETTLGRSWFLGLLQGYPYLSTTTT